MLQFYVLHLAGDGFRSVNQPAKLAMLTLLALLVLFCEVDRTHCLTVPGNETDKLTLLDFKKAIKNDPTGALSSWDITTPYCQWNGVNCSLKHPGRVTMLNLGGYGLSGPISASLGNLTFLKTLNLSTNHFSGELPPLDRLQKLQSLMLSKNLFQGVIPDTLANCSNLEHLVLSGNFLTGEIPLSVGLLSNLVEVQISKNNLIGTIPPSLKNISQLTVLSLADNQLTGSIPDELGQLSNMEALALGANMLVGGIPSALFNLSSLILLDVSINKLRMELPSYFGEKLPNLTWLSLYQNMFEGHIPPSIGNASKLISIHLSHNNFAGQVPSSFGNLEALNYLNLAGNKLEARDNEGWEFLHALANCSFLETLSLSNNQLQGVMPNSIANLSTNLTFLQMGGNKLSGIVPPGIKKFNGLIDLALDFNNLTGTIEDWIGNLTNLQRLNLQSNNFIGTIPPSISNLIQLIYLSLAENKFTGFVTSSLGNLEAVLTLNLSSNNFQGSIPAEFGNFRQLTGLDLSANKFSGEIPKTLSQCQQIYTIQMDQNFLTGNIPVTFSNLKSLSMFNLSHNNLSGPLPAYLNDLESLTKLDLSCNNFQGEIPRNGLYDNATVVSLHANAGLCGGAMDLHMPSCHVVYRRKVGTINYMVKILVPIFGFMSLILLIYIIIHGKKTSRGPYLLLFSFGKQFPKVSYKDLAQATGNFSESNLIGRGSYGSVYKGKLTPAKIQVAIKVFDLEMRYADKSFVSECEVLRRIRHRNLLSILTACSTIDNTGNEFKALIYEFMHNGNLDTWLHHRHASLATNYLGLPQRINIAVDIADALAYLHHDCERAIVHCDLKPTNILLDDDMNAHLGDFGIASLVLDTRSATVGDSGPNSSVAATGTIGYIAPEYAQSVHASTCGDVYSFGIVLLEMIIGKRPTDPTFEDEITIVSFVERNFPDQLLHIIDAHLQEERKGFIQASVESENGVHRCLLSLVQVALSCVRLSPKERMTMREAAINLHSIRRSYVQAIKQEQVRLC